MSGGSITNAYSTGPVTGNGTGGFVGLFNAGAISNAYSTGALIGSNTGGFSGTSSSIACTACFWDTQTSGVGTSTTGTPETTANMMTQATYPVGWVFPTTWNIVAGSYPYLQAFYPTAPTPITISSPASGAAVNLAVGGSVIDTSHTGSNGFIYFLEGNNVLTGINNTISTGTNFIAYLNSGATVGNVVASMPAGGIGGSSPILSIAANTVTVGASSGASTFSNSALGAITNGLSSSNILYTVTSNNLTLTGSDILSITSPTTYTFDGTVTGGSISNNGAMVFNQSGNLTVSEAISGTGSLTQNGSGTLTLTGSNSYGNTLISAGTLQIGSGGATGSLGTGTVTNNSQLTFDLSSTPTVSNNITGSGAVTQSGSGTLILTGSNSYGNTLVSSGTLQIGNGGATGSLGTGTVTNNSQLTFDLSGTATVSNNITGSGALTQNGSGTITLSGSNNYSGATTINAGTLTAGVANAIPSGSTLTLANVAGATFNLNGFTDTIASLSGGGGLGGNVSLGSGTLTIANASLGVNFIYNGVISGPGGNLVVAVNDTEQLGGTNTYTGTTTVNEGFIQANVSGALGPSNGGNINITPTSNVQAAISLNSVPSLTNTNGSINFNSSIAGSAYLYASNILLPNAIVLTGTKNLIDVSTATKTQLSGTITGTGGLRSTDITGSTGILQLNGTSNTYSGTTTISTGGFQANATNAFSPNSAIVLANTANVSLNLNGFNNIIGSLSGGGTTGGNVSLGANTLTTGGDNTSTTFGGAINGTGGLVKNGTGSLTLSNANNFSGGININGGTLVASNAQALGNTAGSTAVNNGATLTINGVNIANEAISLNNATLNGSGTASLSGTGTITLGSSTSDVINSSSGNFTLSNTINGNATLTLQGAGTLTLASNIGLGTTLSSLTANTALTLGGNIGITATNISINNGVTGAFGLTLNGSAIGLAGTLTPTSLTVVGTGASNSLSYSNYTNPITITLSGGLDAASLYSGVTTDNNTANTITNYSNITSIVGNSGQSNLDSLVLSAVQLATVKLNKGSTTSGTVGDPLSFSNFIVVGFVPPTPNPNTPPPVDVSGILQQPQTNASDNTVDSSITLVSVGSNLTDITQQIESLYDVQLSKIKINPFCAENYL